MANNVGAVPTLKRGVCSVNAPELAMSNKDTVPVGVAPEFAAYKYFFDGYNTSDCTACPAVIGLPASCVSAPEFGSSRKITISFEAGIAAYINLLVVVPHPTHVRKG